MNTYDLRIRLASNIVIAGPSQAGKTSLVEEFIREKEQLFYPIPKRVVWCSNSIGNKELLIDKYIIGLPKIEDLKKHDLVVIDDLFLEAAESKDVSNLFTKISHHREVCIVFLTQNLFYQSKQQRNRALSTHYLILFKNPRDLTSIRVIASQIGLVGLKDVYFDATQRPHSYILLDFHQSTPDEIRFRTNILPSQYPIIVYKINK